MHERLAALKKAYDATPIPPELPGMVDRLCREARPQEQAQERTQRLSVWARLWRPLAVAAALLLALTVGVNASPALAQSLGEVPVLGPVVRVLILSSYRLDEQGAHAKVDIAQITGLENPELQEAINAELKANVEAFVAQFERDVADVKERLGEEETVNLAIETFYTVQCANDEVFSLQVEFFWAAGGSDTYFHTYNVNQKTGELLTLGSLFQPDSEYLTVINAYLIAQMKAEEGQPGRSIYWVNEDDLEMDRFTGIDAEHNFYITEAGKLVIAFDKYEVAPGFVGAPTFEIPTELIAGMLAEDAPVH
ncbi:MAG: DUF3298 and DUF4163 domain-containing protein [Anaerolineae bacterium]